MVRFQSDQKPYGLSLRCTQAERRRDGPPIDLVIVSIEIFRVGAKACDRLAKALGTHIHKEVGVELEPSVGRSPGLVSRRVLHCPRRGSELHEEAQALASLRELNLTYLRLDIPGVHVEVVGIHVSVVLEVSDGAPPRNIEMREVSHTTVPDSVSGRPPKKETASVNTPVIGLLAFAQMM